MGKKEDQDEWAKLHIMANSSSLFDQELSIQGARKKFVKTMEASGLMDYARPYLPETKQDSHKIASEICYYKGWFKDKLSRRNLEDLCWAFWVRNKLEYKTFALKAGVAPRVVRGFETAFWVVDGLFLSTATGASSQQQHDARNQSAWSPQVAPPPNPAAKMPPQAFKTTTDVPLATGDSDVDYDDWRENHDEFDDGNRGEGYNENWDESDYGPGVSPPPPPVVAVGRTPPPPGPQAGPSNWHGAPAVAPAEAPPPRPPAPSAWGHAPFQPPAPFESYQSTSPTVAPQQFPQYTSSNSANSSPIQSLPSVAPSTYPAGVSLGSWPIQTPHVAAPNSTTATDAWVPPAQLLAACYLVFVTVFFALAAGGLTPRIDWLSYHYPAATHGWYTLVLLIQGLVALGVLVLGTVAVADPTPGDRLNFPATIWGVLVILINIPLAPLLMGNAIASAIHSARFAGVPAESMPELYTYGNVYLFGGVLMVLIYFVIALLLIERGNAIRNVLIRLNISSERAVALLLLGMIVLLGISIIPYIFFT